MEKQKKHDILLVLLSIYELIRAILIVQISALNQDTNFMQATIVYASPLLILPFIIIVGKIFGSEKLSACTILIPIIKLFSVISFIGYFFLNKSEIVLQLKMNNFKSFYDFILLMIFFIFDVIIGTIFFKNERKIESCK